MSTLAGQLPFAQQAGESDVHPFSLQSQVPDDGGGDVDDVVGGGVVPGGGSLQSGSVLPSGRKQTVPSDSVIVCPGGRAAVVDEGGGIFVGVA